MQRILIQNADIVTENTILQGYCLLVENGRIARLEADMKDIPDASSCQCVDAAGHYLCPGFIDLHFHGIHTYSVDDGPESLAQICRILPRYGVTGFLPTVCPLPKGKDSSALRALASCRSDGAGILGFHLEGPFLSLTGCLPPEALGDADLDRVNCLIDAAKPYKAIFSVSPEFENIIDLLPAMTVGNTPAFLTHTKAGVSQTLEAIAAGACHATHFYDVFYSPDMIEPGVRPCGAVEAILASPGVSVDFILDGVHVDPRKVLPLEQRIPTSWLAAA
jgi:N-acetylglucosamine-6-phosphate deacetylase